MSFRGRLTLFFLLIVVLPMVVIGVLASRTAEDASSGKADARLFGGLETATALYEDLTAQAVRTAEQIGSDTQLGVAIRSGDGAAATAAADRLASDHGAVALELTTGEGEELASVGQGQPFAPALIEIDDNGEVAASLTVSVSSSQDYIDEVERLTGREAAVYTDGETQVELEDGESVDVPASGAADVTADGRDWRVLTGELPGGDGQRIALFGPPAEAGFFESSPTVIAVLAAVLGIALLMVWYLRRHLSRQVAVMLAAAKRIGAGDFSEDVPVIGGERDEMAGLAIEFNKMTYRLVEQMEQLRRQQIEIDRSIRRIGDAVASGLDRQGILSVLAETAVSACGAEYGLIALTGREGAEARSGKASGPMQDAMLAAEAEADRSDEAISRDAEGAHALSAPLRRINDPGRNLGLMTIARSQSRFTPGERDVFLYLIGQAAASIENVALHELVSEQAVTDALTGLSNNRAFREAAEREASRAARFGHPLSLLMLDVDNFKRVNDAHGHVQGDEVLRRIGRILAEVSREIDEPARYGGEEFAVALPETDPEGAAELAERIRERIEAEPVPFPGRDEVLHVTASLGVATMPGSATDVASLIAAADAALYAAKRRGKNRVELAPAGTRAQAAK